MLNKNCEIQNKFIAKAKNINLNTFAEDDNQIMSKY